MAIQRKKLRRLREKAALSQFQLAVKSKVSPQTIYRIERGETDIRTETLKKIAKALNCAIEELLA